MTSGPQMDWLRERLGHLPTCGRPKVAAAMWKTYKIHALWAYTRVGHRPHALYLNITLHNTLPVNMFICFCREICQTLVLLAVRPNGDFCQVPFWNKPRKLWKCKQSSLFVCALMYIYLCIYVFVLFYLLNNCTFQLFVHLVAASLYSLVFMTPVPVKTVRSACVLPYPPMCMPVPLKVSHCMDGGTPRAVSKTQTIKCEIHEVHICL